MLLDRACALMLSAQAMLNTATAHDLIADTCHRLDEMEVVSKRSFRLVVRRAAPDGTPVIVKLWARPGWKGQVRRLLGQSHAQYEFRNLKMMERLGVPAPRAYGFGRATPNAQGYTDAMVMEDLGQIETAGIYLKACVKAGDEAAVTRFEDELIRMTGILARARVIDFDHSMVNIVVRDADPIRLDLEKARRVPWIGLRPKLYGEMIGQLLATYVFAVQPDVDRAGRFAEKLFAEIKPAPSIIKLAQAHVDKQMKRQKDGRGIDMALKLPTV
jgi:tRNA A-37 threonylcarbamoyl transferase component Bud32